MVKVPGPKRPVHCCDVALPTVEQHLARAAQPNWVRAEVQARVVGDLDETEPSVKPVGDRYRAASIFVDVPSKVTPLKAP